MLLFQGVYLNKLEKRSSTPQPTLTLQVFFGIFLSQKNLSNKKEKNENLREHTY